MPGNWSYRKVAKIFHFVLLLCLGLLNIIMQITTSKVKSNLLINWVDYIYKFMNKKLYVEASVTIFLRPPMVDANIMNSPMKMQPWKFLENQLSFSSFFEAGDCNMINYMLITQLVSHLKLNLFGFLMANHIILGSWNKFSWLSLSYYIMKKLNEWQWEVGSGLQNIKWEQNQLNPPKKPRRSPKKGKVTPTNRINAANISNMQVSISSRQYSQSYYVVFQE